MTRLSNSLSHYKWTSQGIEYHFETDTGNRISVLFWNFSETIKEIFNEIQIYSLSIENHLRDATRRTNESDEKTRNTILLILKEFFLNNNNVILFSVLESTDGREKARERLFYKKWYNQFGRDICDMEQLPSLEIDSANIISFLIFPKNFKRKKEILQFMQEYIQESFG